MTDDELDLIEAAVDFQRADFKQHTTEFEIFQKAVVKVAKSRVSPSNRQRFLDYMRARKELPTTEQLGQPLWSELWDEAEAEVAAK